MPHRTIASERTEPGDAEIARELERIRDGVIRSRETETGANKKSILTILTKAAKKGERRVPPSEILAQLRASGYQPSRGDAAAEMAIRKALFDIGRQTRRWYQGHPEHSVFVCVSTGGQIAAYRGQLPVQFGLADTSDALRTVLAQLPDVVRNLTGSPPRTFASTDLDVARSVVHEQFGRALTLADDDIVLVHRVLYASTCHAIEMAVRAYGKPIIAVEHYPTHQVSKWDDALLWLKDAYRDHRLRAGEGSIVRIVVVEPTARAVLTQDDEWERWTSHIYERLITDDVHVLIDPKPTWQAAIGRDLLVLPKVLVVEYDRDHFPYKMRVHQGTEASRITKTAEEIALGALEDRKNQMYQLKNTADVHKQFHELRTTLMAHDGRVFANAHHG